MAPARSRHSQVSFALFLLIFSYSTTAIGQLLSGYVRPLTISHLQVPNSDQTNFPVLVSGTYPFLATVTNGGRVLNASGYDIVFTSDAAGQNLLPFEIDNYNAVTGAAGFWVQVPTISHTTDTTIYIWYGIPGITQSQENKAGVWSNGFAAVWHMGNGTTLSTTDSTGINGNATNVGVIPTTGFIGGGGSFSNQTSPSYLDIANNPSFKPARNLTLEAWFNASSVTAWNKIIGLDYRADGSWNSPYLAYALQNYESTNQFGLQVTEGGNGPAIGTPNTYTLNTWNQAVGTYDGNQMIVYLNAVPSQPFPEVGPIDYGSSQDLTIGTRSPYSISNAEGWQGILDEVRISSVTRSPDWISTEYNNQSNPSGFYGVGSELTGAGTPVPVIHSITTAPSGSGSIATIQGASFGASQGTSTITLNGIAFHVRSWNSTTIRVDEPNLQATGLVVVTVNAASSFPEPYPTATVSQIFWTAPAPITLGTALSTAQLNATASTAGSFVYSPALGTLLPMGKTQLTVTFTPTDPVNYTSVTANTIIAVVPSVPVQLPQSGIIATVAGDGIPGYSGDGAAATEAELNNPYGVAVDSAGNIYIPDTINSAIRKVSAATGIISTVVGDGSQGYSGDGGAATSATLNYPYGVTVDAAGNLYIADTGNNVIRKVSAASGIISTVVGTGTAGYAGDGGPALSAQLSNPTSVALDSLSNIYVADWQNNAVRRVTAGTAIITTVAGTGSSGYFGDSGPATSAQLNQPFSVTLDSMGDLFIADSGNNRLREVLASTGGITTVAGNGSAGYAGDGGAATTAQLNYPTGILIDESGNLDISDTQNSVIRRVNFTSGQISTIAGSGTAGYTGDNSQASNSSLNLPAGLALDALGNLYVSDSANSAIRVIGSTTKLNGNSSSAPTGGRDLILVTGTVQSTISGGQTIYDSGTLTVSLVTPTGNQVTVNVPWGGQDSRFTLAQHLAAALTTSSSEIKALALANRVQIYSTTTGLPASLAIGVTATNNPLFSLSSLLGALLDSSTANGVQPIAPFCAQSPQPPNIPGMHVIYSLPQNVSSQAIISGPPANNGSAQGCLFSPSPWWWLAIDALEGQPPIPNQGCPKYDSNPTQMVASLSLTKGEPLGTWWWGEQFSNFQSVQLPPNAVVQGIYGVETGTISGSGAYSVMTLNGTNPLDSTNFVNSEATGSGTCYTFNQAPPYGNLTVADIPSQNLGAFVFDTVYTDANEISTNFDTSYAAFATYYTIGSGAAPASPPSIPQLNITITSSNTPVQSISTSEAASKTAFVPLGSQFEVVLTRMNAAGSPAQLPATYSLANAVLQNPIGPKALFPYSVVFMYNNNDGNAAVFQASHLGTQTLTISPSDGSFAPVVVTLTVIPPMALGSGHNDIDSLIVAAADWSGILPQFLKGQMQQESGGHFNPMAYRYEPLSEDYNEISDVRYPARTMTQDLRLALPYSNYRLATEPDCSVKTPLAQGSLITQADINVRDTLLICNDVVSSIATTCPTADLGHLAPFNVEVPAWLIIEANDSSAQHHGQHYSTENAATFATVLQAQANEDNTGTQTCGWNWTAQTDLAASYGFMQILYSTAISAAKWEGADGGLKDPSLLFDTADNLRHHGGSLYVGAKVIDLLARTEDLSDATTPNFLTSASLVAFMKKAWHGYDPRKNVYATMVYTKTLNWVPVPSRSIFGGN